MASRVHFLSLTKNRRKSPQLLLKQLLEDAGLRDTIEDGDITAIKLHIGEAGNLAYIRPPYVETVVSQVKELGGKPFLTDSTTLYTGRRRNGLDLIRTAESHGFTGVSVGAHVLPADGIKGNEAVSVPSPIEGNPLVHLGAAVAKADALICLSHFKGHELAGFGGAIKNMAMGCSTKAGKFYMHAQSKPYVDPSRCIGCGKCLEWCAYDAIELNGGTAVILDELCTGCAHCLMACSVHAIHFHWDLAPSLVQKRMAEYVKALVDALKGRVFYVNFLTDVSPACDCYPFNGPPLVQSLGILAGDDPVAVDAASWKLVNDAPALPGSEAEGLEPGADKFRHLYQDVDPSIQLAEAERLGVGSRNFELC